MTEAPLGSGRRLPSLDFLRGIAIILVLFRHAQVAPADAGALVVALTGALRRGGWIGVDLFFVLSGFLVSGLIFDELRRSGSFSPGRFLLRRGFKIYPAFYVMLALEGARRAGAGVAPPLREIAAEAAFVTNYASGFLVCTWTLAVEEHFYLLLALGLWAATRGRPERARWAALAFFPAAVLCLLVRLEAGRRLARVGFSGTHARIDSLLFGVLLSYLHHYRREALAAFVARWRRALLAAPLVLALPAFVVELYDPWLVSLGLTGLYVGFGAALLAVVHAPSPPGAGAWGRALAWVGARSYSIYLWHTFAHDFSKANLYRHGAEPYLLWLPAYFALALGGGAFMTWLVERPALRLRERLAPSRAGAAVGP